MGAKVYNDFDWGVLKALIGGNRVVLSIAGDRKTGDVVINAVIRDTARMVLEEVEVTAPAKSFAVDDNSEGAIMPEVVKVLQRVVDTGERKSRNERKDRAWTPGPGKDSVEIYRHEHTRRGDCGPSQPSSYPEPAYDSTHHPCAFRLLLP